MQNHIYGPFSKYIKPRFSEIPCSYLEIGASSGSTARFMLASVLLHEQSKADLVDPWCAYEAEPDRRGNPRIYTVDAMTRAKWLVTRLCGWYPDKARMYSMTSDEFFKVTDCTYDFIFIDGLHDGDTVLSDGINGLKTLNDGGLIAFDDMTLPAVRGAVAKFVEHAEETCAINEYYRTKHQICLSVQQKDH